MASLSFGYGKTPVLHEVSLDVGEGEIVGVFGPNGAGKTTLLRVVCGLERPDGGRVLLFGEDVTGMGADRLARKGLTAVFAGRSIFSELTVEENLRVGGQVLWSDAKLLEERVDEAFAAFPILWHRRKLRAGRLSGGEQQMLAMAKAFVMRPRVLCIDELSLGLGPRVVQELGKSVARLRGSGLTILLVEQAPSVLGMVADRVALMRRGRVVEVVEGKTFRRGLASRITNLETWK